MPYMCKDNKHASLTKFMHKSLKIGFPLICNPVFPAVPIFSESFGEHAGMVWDQVVLEEFGVGYFFLYVLNEMRRAVLLLDLSGHFDQTTAVVKSFPIHDMPKRNSAPFTDYRYMITINNK